MRRYLFLLVATSSFLAGCAGSHSLPLGSSTFVWGSSDPGLVDGPSGIARFSNPAGIESAPNGTVYVSDYDNDAIRMIAPTGDVTTIVKQANFSQPFGLALAPDGTLYVSTDRDDAGRKDATTGTVWKVLPGALSATVVARDLGRPRGILAISASKLVMADIIHDTISTLDVTTGQVTVIAGVKDQVGHVNGNGASARFSRPYGLVQMGDGSLLVADTNNNRIRRLTLFGDVTDFAGSGTASSADGPVGAAAFRTPQDVAISGSDVYVADTGNHVIRKISGGAVSTFAGNGIAGFADGAGAAAEFYGLEAIAIAPGSPDLWLTDGQGGDGSPHNRVRRIRLQ